jgi:hypothetical protein
MASTSWMGARRQRALNNISLMRGTAITANLKSGHPLITSIMLLKIQVDLAVDTSRYVGPRILNSQIKRHILTRNLAF